MPAMHDLALVSSGTSFCPECERMASFTVHGQMETLTWKDCPPATVYALVLHCNSCGRAVEHELLDAASLENARRLGEAFAAIDRLRARGSALQHVADAARHVCDSYALTLQYGPDYDLKGAIALLRAAINQPGIWPEQEEEAHATTY